MRAALLSCLVFLPRRGCSGTHQLRRTVPGPVALGPAIADAPRTDPYKRRYRIQLLPKVVTRRSVALDKNVAPDGAGSEASRQ
jgi:hypothetical protein